MIIEFIVHTFGSSGGQKKVSCCSSFKIQHHFTEKSFRNSTGIDHSTHRTLAILPLHAVKRIFERGISRNCVSELIRTSEIIESYPDDTPFPSCLIMGRCQE